MASNLFIAVCNYLWVRQFSSTNRFERNIANFTKSETSVRYELDRQRGEKIIVCESVLLLYAACTVHATTTTQRPYTAREQNHFHYRLLGAECDRLLNFSRVHSVYVAIIRSLFWCNRLCYTLNLALAWLVHFTHTANHNSFHKLCCFAVQHVVFGFIQKKYRFLVGRPIIHRQKQNKARR